MFLKFNLLIFSSHFASLQCHMILQKSFYAKLEPKKNFLSMQYNKM